MMFKRPGLTKRRKEQIRDERKRQKEERKAQRQKEREERATNPGDPDEDPDIAGIVPGPQPPNPDE
jgi:hypothetical protein